MSRSAPGDRPDIDLMYAAVLTIALTGPTMLVCAGFPHSWAAVGYLPLVLLLALFT